MRYFIHLSYDGTAYHGWQIQPNGISVEGEMERCLSTLLRQPIDIVGAGRTDAGVHARHMVAHFDIDEDAAEVPFSNRHDDISTYRHDEMSSFAATLKYKLNRLLPPDIAVHSIEAVSDDMHARFSATSRTYHYYLCTERSPFNRHYTWLTHFDLDFALMNRAAELLLHTSDFACFCKSHTDVKTTLCQVSEAQWVQTSPSEWHFRITANRFLRNMVRAVVGTLIEVGRHRMSIEQFQAVLDGRQRTQAGESMPAHALFLEEIRY